MGGGTALMSNLDQDRGLAEALDLSSRGLRLLAENEKLRGADVVTLPIVPSGRPHDLGAIPVTLLADLLKHAAIYVNEHTP
jgi:hypothetical protein